MRNRFLKLKSSGSRDNYQLLRYLLVGSWNAFFSLSSFYLLLHVVGDNFYEQSLLITFFVSTLQSYLTQRAFVWRTGVRDIREFFHFFAVCLVQYFANAGVLYLLVSIAGLSPKFCQIPVSFLIALASYLYFKTKVFTALTRKVLG